MQSLLANDGLGLKQKFCDPNYRVVLEFMSSISSCKFYKAQKMYTVYKRLYHLKFLFSISFFPSERNRCWFCEAEQKIHNLIRCLNRQGKDFAREKSDPKAEEKA